MVHFTSNASNRITISKTCSILIFVEVDYMVFVIPELSYDFFILLLLLAPQRYSPLRLSVSHLLCSQSVLNRNIISTFPWFSLIFPMKFPSLSSKKSIRLYLSFRSLLLYKNFEFCFFYNNPLSHWLLFTHCSFSSSVCLIF